MPAQDLALPPLRQELSLQAAPPGPDGAPTWTLHDPGCNRFYQLGWPAFEILSRWPLGSIARVLAALRAETTLQQLEAEDIEALAAFLQRHHLLLTEGAAGTARLASYSSASRQSPWQWLLHHYLFFRIPLFRPMPLLARTARAVRFVYEPRFWAAIAAVALLGLFLVRAALGQLRPQLHRLCRLAGAGRHRHRAVAGQGVARIRPCAYAYRHGCRVPAMGVAFLVMWPVLYTDTNEAWKLGSRRARLQIGVAGMAAELALAACATLLWSFLPDGPLRAGVFMLATSTWVITLAINLSPFMRFDGYFLLSDLLNMPNLHERAFAFGRWRLREALFGLGAPAPEALPPSRQRLLVLFAWATWVYRLLLFVGIALLVYHLFFKLLGLLLLAVELGWFVALPVWREIAAWRQMRGALRWNGASRRSMALALAALLLVLLPIWGGLRAPAMLVAERAQRVYAPAAARVLAVHAKPGDSVRAGQLLIELESPDLQAQLARAQAQERKLHWQLEQQDFDPRLQAAGSALASRWQAARRTGRRAGAGRTIADPRGLRRPHRRRQPGPAAGRMDSEGRGAAATGFAGRRAGGGLHRRGGAGAAGERGRGRQGPLHRRRGRPARGRLPARGGRPHQPRHTEVPGAGLAPRRPDRQHPGLAMASACSRCRACSACGSINAPAWPGRCARSAAARHWRAAARAWPARGCAGSWRSGGAKAGCRRAGPGRKQRLLPPSARSSIDQRSRAFSSSLAWCSAARVAGTSLSTLSRPKSWIMPL